MSYYYDSELDRKSSRGMIYENEELRLRTININAEVERGQSDIKRLRRENEHLRREIWTLRDECDRLNKRFKAKLVGNSHDHGGCTARTSGGSGGCPGRRGSCSGLRQRSSSNSGDSDSCDTCKGENDEHCVDDYSKYTPNDCCIDGSCKLPPFSSHQQLQQLVEGSTGTANHPHAPSANTSTNSEDHQVHANFDHLSVVSEETLSNSDVLATSIHSGNLLSYTTALSGSPTSLPSLVRPLTPLTPVELVANELHDLQSAVPPLSYFENIVQQHMSPQIGNTPESAQTTNSGKTVIQTNGWDYNLQSPFTQHKYPMSSPSSSTRPRSPAPILTSFVPTSALSPHYVAEQVLSGREPIGETIAITTSPTNGTPTINNPKHFFSPLKPRLKINTTLANRNTSTAVVPQPPVVPQNYDPPDVFVANALATPYQRPDQPASSESPAEHAFSHHHSPQVSPRLCRRHNHEHRQRQQHHQYHHHHHHQKRHQYQQQQYAADVAGGDGGGFTNVSAAAALNKHVLLQQLHDTQKQQDQKNVHPTYTKLTKPIYATANKRCNNISTAPAVTQPLMTTIVVTTLPSMTTSSTISYYRSSKTTLTMTTATETMVGLKQSHSPNLEAILNDIETISEDILAIQLENNKSRDNLNEASSSASVISATQASKHLERAAKNMKPYRSEMNLLLSYDGPNPTITPTTFSKTFSREGRSPPSNQTTDNNNTTGRVRARSLEREHTDSPSPNVPDPMAPFPYNRSYIGFDKLNAATSKPPLPPSSQGCAQATGSCGGGVSNSGTPSRPMPPTPPVRTPSSLTLSAQHQQQQTQTGSPASVLTPNKSHLYAAIANAAAAKRAQFRSMSSRVTKSLDTDRLITVQTEEEAQAAETSRRKARRVSIVCGDSSREDSNAQAEGRNAATTPTAPLGSCTDLQAPNPIIMHLRQTSHSTPNSPHSLRRGSIGVVESPSVGTPHHHSLPPGIHTPHQSHQRGASFSAPHRKCSQDSTRGITNAVSDLAAAAAAAVASRSRCSRRNSDGTVVSGLQRISNSSVRHHHQHNHHHHQHQHSSSLVTANPHPNRHSRQDSNLETGTSISDRNSNSITSSAESSASFSLRSQRRKISISSHAGGKIPWCGCWGNGCL